MNNRQLINALSMCIMGCGIVLGASASNAADLKANFRLYGEVNRFSFIGFGDVGIYFGVNESPRQIGSISYSPGSNPGTATGVLGSVSLPAFGYSVIDTTFSVPFSLDVGAPGSLYVGLGDNGFNGFSGGSKQVIFDFSDNIRFLDGILQAAPNQGLSLESVTLSDGTSLENVGLSLEFITGNTLLTAGVSAFDVAGIGGIVTSVFATDNPPNSALIGDFTIKSVASSKLKGGPDGVSGPNKSLFSLDINPEPDPLVFDVAFATVSGSNNILLARVTPPPSSQSVPTPMSALGLAAAFGYSRKLRKRIKSTSDLPLASSMD
jgi:hypothetical protein